MNVLDILIYILKEIMHEAIDKYGVHSQEALSLSQKLDLLILERQKDLHTNYINMNNA